MSIAERLYNVTKELPEPLLGELLDFAETLRQRKSQGKLTENIAQRIHQRFANLEGEELPIPERQLSRMPPQWER